MTSAGEQYSIAALLYQLWTGVYYIDWSLERDELLRQVIEEPPVAFERRNLAAWPSLEAILGRALGKRPEQRYPNMGALAADLAALADEAERRDRDASIRRKTRERENDLLDRTLKRYALGGEALIEGPADAPLASLNYGAGGVAYAIYRIAQTRDDARLLSLADVWIQKAFALSPHDNAFYDPRKEIEEATVGNVSLFHSPTGLHCVRALVAAALGDIVGANRAIRAFVDRARRPCDNPDLTLGRASLLLGCAELVEALPAQWLIDVGPARSLGDEIARDLTELITPGCAWAQGKITMLGIAHGWGGCSSHCCVGRGRRAPSPRGGCATASMN